MELSSDSSVDINMKIKSCELLMKWTVSLLSSPDNTTVTEPDVALPPTLTAGLRHAWGPVICAAVSIHEPRQLAM